MNWDAIGSIGEIISALAVVTSLVYLAIQLRINSKTLKASSAWDAEKIFAEANVQSARDPAFSSLARRYMSPDSSIDDFTEDELSQTWFALVSVVQAVQAQYFLWREGSLPDYVWRYRVAFIRNFILLPVVEVNWEQMKTQNILADEFVSEVESQLGTAHFSQVPRSE